MFEYSGTVEIFFFMVQTLGLLSQQYEYLWLSFLDTFNFQIDALSDASWGCVAPLTFYDKYYANLLLPLAMFLLAPVFAFVAFSMNKRKSPHGDGGGGGGGGGAASVGASDSPRSFSPGNSIESGRSSPSGGARASGRAAGQGYGKGASGRGAGKSEYGMTNVGPPGSPGSPGSPGGGEGFDDDDGGSDKGEGSIQAMPAAARISGRPENYCDHLVDTLTGLSYFAVAPIVFSSLNIFVCITVAGKDLLAIDTSQECTGMYCLPSTVCPRLFALNCLPSTNT